MYIATLEPSPLLIQWAIYRIMARANGFRYPFGKMQVAGWVFYLFNVGVATGVMLSEVSEWWVVGVFVVCWAGVLGFGGWITGSDPTAEPRIEEGHRAAYGFHCDLCMTFVEEQTKHCGACDRCVEGFDHHCKWVNNCIGKMNYKEFVGLIVMLELGVCAIIWSNVYVLSEVAVSLANTIFWVILVSLLVNLVVFFLNGYLICFHVYLKVRSMTTYQFLCSKRIYDEKAIKMTEKGEERMSTENP